MLHTHTHSCMWFSKLLFIDMSKVYLYIHESFNCRKLVCMGDCAGWCVLKTEVFLYYCCLQHSSNYHFYNSTSLFQLLLYPSKQCFRLLSFDRGLDVKKYSVHVKHKTLRQFTSFEVNVFEVTQTDYPPLRLQGVVCSPFVVSPQFRKTVKDPDIWLPE